MYSLSKMGTIFGHVAPTLESRTEERAVESPSVSKEKVLRPSMCQGVPAWRLRKAIT